MYLIIGLITNTNYDEHFSQISSINVNIEDKIISTVTINECERKLSCCDIISSIYPPPTLQATTEKMNKKPIIDRNIQKSP
jgi:hypothetical protein